jgi:hypothetical protein
MRQEIPGRQFRDRNISANTRQFKREKSLRDLPQFSDCRKILKGPNLVARLNVYSVKQFEFRFEAEGNVQLRESQKPRLE